MVTDSGTIPSNMQSLDLTLPTPQENLALDEALLDAVDAGKSPEILRFWESPTPFVVVGYGNHLSTEANLPACEKSGIPVLRRCSGGGTVIQGPGCLSYAVILRFDEASPLASVSGANQFIMERQREALENLLGKPVSISGHTDLAVGEMKFSGNAQRRKRSALLFHGTFLLNFDLPLINRCLRFPSIVPDYRSKRSHLDFVTNLGISKTSLKSALCKAWNTHETLESPPLEETHQLCEDRYNRPEWHTKRP